MKKVLLVVLALSCLSLIGHAQVAQNPESSPQKCEKLQAKLQKKIESCKKRAKYYQKLAATAEQQNNKNLAEAYTKCADAKQKIADGMENVYKNTQTCQEICSQNPELKSVLCKKGDFKYAMGQKKKRGHMTTHIKKMEQCADMCLQKAKQAEQAGKPELAQQYSKLSSAINGKMKGCELVVEGNKEFKAARKEIKELKTAAEKEETTKE